MATVLQGSEGGRQTDLGPLPHPDASGPGQTKRHLPRSLSRLSMGAQPQSTGSCGSKPRPSRKSTSCTRRPVSSRAKSISTRSLHNSSLSKLVTRPSSEMAVTSSIAAGASAAITTEIATGIGATSGRWRVMGALGHVPERAGTNGHFDLSVRDGVITSLQSAAPGRPAQLSARRAWCLSPCS